jgi:hypothetical protein
MADKSKKVGRNSASCKAYKLSNRREKNKSRKLSKHLKKFPDDKVAIAALDLCRKVIKGY